MANPQNLNKGGTFGNKGGGRPKDEWKAALQAMASAEQTMQHVLSVLKKGPGDPNFFKALEYATDHGYGKATQGFSFEDIPLPKLIELLKS